MASYWHSEAGRREVAELGRRFPSLRFEPAPNGGGRASGLLEVATEISYTMDLRISKGYPAVAPAVFCREDEVPFLASRHVFGEPRGRACLCARLETRRHWPKGSDLSDFVESLVRPYFTGQHYFECHGEWPPSGQRSHNRAGIVEAGEELVAPLGSKGEDVIISTLRLLARRNPPKGHETCPCGSDKRLRVCHRHELLGMREMVDPDDAMADLMGLVRNITS